MAERRKLGVMVIVIYTAVVCWVFRGSCATRSADDGKPQGEGMGDGYESQTQTLQHRVLCARRGRGGWNQLLACGRGRNRGARRRVAGRNSVALCAARRRRDG